MQLRVARCARPVAVRLDIRPRIRLAPEPTAASRPRFRLPALALPAVGYWLAMAALTYTFTKLGPRPLEQAFAAEAPAQTEPATSTAEVELAATAPAAPDAAAAASAGALAELTVASPSAPSAPLELEPLPLPASRRTPAKRLRGASREPPEREGSFEVPSLSELPQEQRAEEPRLLNFPEFTDSAPRQAREHAAAGPRIDSVFEPRTDGGPSATSEAPPPSEPRPEARRPLTSCEAAVARNNEQLEIGGPRGPADITREAYASILQNGRYLSQCRVPPRAVLEICAAVKHGRAVGVTVTSNPANAALETCVRSSVAALTFPNSERLDVTHTRFDAASR